MNDPENVARCGLTGFVTRDPGLGDLIAEEDAGAWERAAVGAPWQRVVE